MDRREFNMADDGGVQAKLDSAKQALKNTSNSNVSPAQSPYAPPKPIASITPKPSYTQARTARSTGGSSPSVGDELEAKRKNVEQYASSQ
jgi:hypothetical protein